LEGTTSSTSLAPEIEENLELLSLYCDLSPDLWHFLMVYSLRTLFLITLMV
jgi:hypothetical protein